MKKLFIKETYEDIETNNIYHISDENEFDGKNLKDLYKMIRKNMKGKIQKMYYETKNGNSTHVGYTITRNAINDNSGETYKERVWLELFEEIEVMELVKKSKPWGIK